MPDCSEFATKIGKAAEALIHDDIFSAQFGPHGADNYDLVVKEIQSIVGEPSIPRADISQAWTEYRRSLAEKRKKSRPGMAAEIRREAYTETDKADKGREIENQLASGNFRLLKGLGLKNKKSEAMKALDAHIADLMDQRRVPMKIARRIEELGGKFTGTDIKAARELRDKLIRQKQLGEAIAKREAKIKAGEIAPEPKTAPRFSDDPEVARLMAEMEAGQKKINEMRAALKRDATADERALREEERKKAQLERAIAEAGQFRQPGATVDSAEVARLKGELASIRKAQADAKRPTLDEQMARAEARRVEQIQRAIAEAEARLENPNLREGGATVETAETARLRAELAAVNKRIAEMQKPSLDERALKAEEARQKQLAKALESARDKLAGGAGKMPGATVDTMTVAAMKSELAALNRELSDNRIAETLTAALAEIADLVENRQFSEKQKVNRREARADIAAMRADMKQWKARERVLRTLKAMRDAVESGDYSAFEKKTYFEPGGKPPLPPELVALNYEADKMRRDIESEIEAQRPLSKGEKILHGFEFLRSNILSIDRGALLRQGAKAALANPTEFYKAFKSARYGGRMTDESATRIYNETISKVPLQERLDTGLEKIIPEAGSTARLTDGERIGGGRVAKAMRQSDSKFLRFWAEAIADSDRSMAIFLGRLRMEMYLSAVSAYDGQLTIEDKRNLVQDIAIATGRGSFKNATADSFLAMSSNVFLAPRWMLSQWQYLAKILTSGLSNNRATRTSRRIALKRYGRHVAAYAALMGIASLFADEAEKDPRSTNFGKVRFGNRWVGLTGGLGKAATLLARIVTGQTKTREGKVVGLVDRDSQPIGWIGGKTRKKGYGQSIQNAFGSYFATSLAPLPKLAFEAASREDVVGRKVTALSLFEGLLTPLQLGQIVDTMVAEGMTPALAWEFLGIIGADMRRENDDWKDPAKGPGQKVFEKVREKMRDVPEEPEEPDEMEGFKVGSASAAGQ